jgi:beta-ribofuranosylaminobenzene 5'-phosphate synthase
MTRAVTVTTGARLHFGLIVAAGDDGPSFASVGAMVDEPGFTLRMEAAEAKDAILAPESVARRVAEFLALCRAAGPAPPVRVEVSRAIPGHIGLGSGTQLALAVRNAVAALFERQALPNVLGRGRRSSIGIHGFHHGGMSAHGLRSSTTGPGRQLLHHALPEAWRFVLITPPVHQGLSGAAETRAFQQMPPMPAVLCDRLYRLVLETWWPALERGDVGTFGEALYEFGIAIGEYFAPYQGGAFAQPQMAELVEHLRDTGLTGVAQTSWGPTIAALCADEALARDVRTRLLTDSRWSDCTVRTVAPLNRGASIHSS